MELTVEQEGILLVDPLQTYTVVSAYFWVFSLMAFRLKLTLSSSLSPACWLTLQILDVPVSIITKANYLKQISVYKHRHMSYWFYFSGVTDMSFNSESNPTHCMEKNYRGRQKYLCFRLLYSIGNSANDLWWPTEVG